MRKVINTALVALWLLLMLGMPNCSNNRAPDIDTSDVSRPN